MVLVYEFSNDISNNSCDSAIGNHSKEYCFNGKASINDIFTQPLVLITLNIETILITAIGICCAIGLVGMNRASKISNTTVIAIG